VDHEYGDYESGKRRDCEETPTMGLRERTEQGEVRPVNRKPKADNRETREYSDKDTEDEKKYFLVEDAFEGGE
jgi:hypothetical protein